MFVARYMGTITGIGDLDPVRWPNSHWRSVKVCKDLVMIGLIIFYLFFAMVSAWPFISREDLVVMLTDNTL